MFTDSVSEAQLLYYQDVTSFLVMVKNITFNALAHLYRLVDAQIHTYTEPVVKTSIATFFLILNFDRFLLCLEALESGLCDVIKIRFKKEGCNEKLERKPAAKYQNSCRAANLKVELLFNFTSCCIPPLQRYFYDVTQANFQRFLCLA